MAGSYQAISTSLKTVNLYLSAHNTVIGFSEYVG
jgi:hypothetical protein